MNEADKYFRERDKAVARAEAELAKFYSGVDWSEPLRAKEQLTQELPLLVEQWSAMIGQIGLDYAAAMGTPAKYLAPVDNPVWDAIVNSIKWAIEPLFGTDKPDSAGAKRLLNGSMTRHMQQGNRESLRNIGRRYKELRYARVLRGEYDCAFCIVLASRGDVCYTEESAGYDIREVGGDKYHDWCDCDIVLVRSDDDFPAGYNPEEYFDMYESVHESGDTIADVAQRMREKFDHITH